MYIYIYIYILYIYIICIYIVYTSINLSIYLSIHPSIYLSNSFQQKINENKSKRPFKKSFGKVLLN